MLKEWEDLYQRPGERRRRCFTDEHFEIYLFFEPDGRIHHIQLIYLLEKGEPLRTMLWHQNDGYRHSDVDSGEGEGFQHNTGRAFSGSAAGPFDKKTVLRLFTAAAADMEQDIREFISETIASFPDS
jgi:hypothetical protein